MGQRRRDRMGDEPGSRGRCQPTRDPAADLKLSQFSKQHLRRQEVVFDKAAEGTADPVFVVRNDRGVRNRHSQWMAEESRHGEPVGQTTDHASLSAGLDQQGQKARFGNHAGRHKHGAHAGQHDRREEAVAPQPLPPDHVGPVRYDARPLPTLPRCPSLSLPRLRGRVGWGPGKYGLVRAHPESFRRPGGTGLSVGRWCSRKLPTRGTANFRKAIRNGRSSTLAREQADMIPVAYIEHQLPGRVRLRVPSRCGEVPFFEQVVRELSKHPAMRELTATPLTGSITLRYFEPLHPIIAAAVDQRLFETSRLVPQSNVSDAKPAAALREGSGLTDGIATGLSGLSLFQVTQGSVFGSAAENLWHAFGAQRILGRPDIAAAFAVLGIYKILRGQLFGSASSLFFYALMMRQMAATEQARARGRAVAAARTAKSSSSALTGSDPKPPPCLLPPAGESKSKNPPPPAGEGRKGALAAGSRRSKTASELSS